MASAYWKVVGGAEKGGIIVRMGAETDSIAFGERLSTGSIVEEVDKSGDRLCYSLLEGSGPQQGWVSLKFKGKPLVVSLDRRAVLRPALGGVLPPIERSKHLPGGMAVAEKMREIVFRRVGLDKEREPKLYVLVFPGAVDEVQNGWLRMECEAPPNIEVATYEWPGHGKRSDEPCPKTIQQLGDDAFEAIGGLMCQGHCIFVGHSIGALIMTHVCERAQRELHQAPLAAIVLDRGPPHLAHLSDYIMEVNRRDPESFAAEYGLGHLEPGSFGWKTLITDLPLDNDTRPVGWYKYPCPLHVVAAEHAVPGLEKFHRSGHALAFPPEEMELWRDWASDVKISTAKECIHQQVKTSEEFYSVLSSETKRLLEPRAA